MANIHFVVDGDRDSLLRELSNIDLSPMAWMMDNTKYRDFFLGDAGKEHYKLLAYISLCFEGETIYDIGTHFGNSSLALAYCKKSKIISYDIVDIKQIINSPDNVEYRIGDFTEDLAVLRSPFVFIDVDPHDGIQESNFHEFFLNN